MHLRMTGTLLLDPPPGTPYGRVRLALDDGAVLRFCDPRRFGTGELARSSEELSAFFAARLGVEPLGPEFTPERLRELARGRRAPVKAWLLDQTTVAGVGNIYADEALFRARIHPLRPAGALKPAQVEALRDGVVEALTAGLAAGGRPGARTRPPGWGRGGRGWWGPSPRGWPPGARRSTTSAMPTASWAPSRTSSSSTAERASRA